MWNPVYLRFIDPGSNKLRFYSIHVTKSVFSDDWEVVREWGRIGSPGTVRTEAFKEKEDAEAYAEMFKTKKNRASITRSQILTQIFKCII